MGETTEHLVYTGQQKQSSPSVIMLDPLSHSVTVTQASLSTLKLKRPRLCALVLAITAAWVKMEDDGCATKKCTTSRRGRPLVSIETEHQHHLFFRQVVRPLIKQNPALFDADFCKMLSLAFWQTGGYILLVPNLTSKKKRDFNATTCRI